MGGTVSISIREGDNVERVRELLKDKPRMKQMFQAIIKNAIEVENIDHPSNGPQNLFLADVICYITKQVDPFLENFFHGGMSKFSSNIITQIVSSAFDYAVKVTKPSSRRTFIKKEAANHKFAEVPFKGFSAFLSALLYFDHLWDLFDIADDNIDDDSIFLGEFMRARNKIEEIEGVKFLRHVTEEEWKQEFDKIDNGDVKDGWISFLEFARYASMKMKTPEKYVLDGVATLGKVSTPKNKRMTQMKTIKESDDNPHETFLDEENDTKQLKPSEMAMKMKGAALAVEATAILENAVKEAKKTHTGKSSFIRPKSLLARYHQKLSENEMKKESTYGYGRRKVSLFRATPSDDPSDSASEGSQTRIHQAIAHGKTIVAQSRLTSFRNRLQQYENQITDESEAAKNMRVSTVLSPQLVKMREDNAKLANPKRKRKKKKRRVEVEPETVGPFSFADVSIGHIKPNSNAAEVITQRELEYATYGKTLHVSHSHDHFDDRPFSLRNLTRVMKVFSEKAKSDDMRCEKSGIFTPRPRIFSEEMDNSQLRELNAAQEDRVLHERRATVRSRVQSAIHSKDIGQRKAKEEKENAQSRPKSASSVLSKSSFSNFEKHSSSEVQSFFGSYTKSDKDMVKNVKESNAEIDASNSSVLLTLHSEGEPTKDSADDFDNENVNDASPYHDVITAEPHFVRGKLFTDRGHKDRKLYGNERFDNERFCRPRQGHLPSKHDTLQGKPQYELWNSKNDKTIAYSVKSPVAKKFLRSS